MKGKNKWFETGKRKTRMEKMNPPNWLLWKPLAFAIIFAWESREREKGKRTFFIVGLQTVQMIHFQNISIRVQHTHTHMTYKSFRLSIIKSLIKKMICAMATATDTIFLIGHVFWSLLSLNVDVCCQFQFCTVFWLQAFRNSVWTAFDTHTLTQKLMHVHVDCETHY